jgi:rubrerythrin
MPITYREISSEVENLHHELKRHKDEKLSHKDKIAVSDLLAETVAMIRRKYELTTVYYLASEIKAADGIGPADKCERVDAEWFDDLSEPSWIICSGCGWKDWHDRNTKFCPKCGRRMKNGE